MPIAALDQLRQIPTLQTAQFPRGGAYDPATNVWICHELASLLATLNAEEVHLFQVLAQTALAAGALHRRQLADNRAGQIWPRRWIAERDGDALVAFCLDHPDAATPYACLNDGLVVAPYSAVYRQELSAVVQGVEALLACAAPSAQQQAAYLAALKRAYTVDPVRRSDLALMGKVDEAWVATGAEVNYLLLCEFAESYSDPLKPLVLDQPSVAAWATEVAAQNGVGPWRAYFEFRVLGRVDDAVTPAEISAIRTSNRALYRTVSDFIPSTNVKTEFRRAIITAGHGANPPKSAKNYPNQSWIRQEQGYRNIIFANQLEEKTRQEAIPALRAALTTDWVTTDAFVATMLRATALAVVAHEETHPWCTFSGIPWLEEMKCDVLGMYSILQAPRIAVDPADLLLSGVASDLLLHRYHQFLVTQKNDTQFEDYYIGSTILLNHLFRGGFFQVDGDGIVVDVKRAVAGQLIAQLAQRILAIKAGAETHAALHEQLFDEGVYDRFRGWDETQAYFVGLWE